MFGLYVSSSRSVVHDAEGIKREIVLPERTIASFGPTVWQLPMIELNFDEVLYTKVLTKQNCYRGVGERPL